MYLHFAPVSLNAKLLLMHLQYRVCKQPFLSPPPAGQIPNVVAAAASILLKMQPGVAAFEKDFRAEFGNNPDTSKALRL